MRRTKYLRSVSVIYLRSNRIPIRAYSQGLTGELVRVRDVPSPNGGVIRILTLGSFANRNAFSRDMLQAINREFEKIYQKIPRTKFSPLPQPPHKKADGKQGVVASEEDRGETDEILDHTLENEIHDPIRALIIGSHVKGVFSAGADLKEREQMTVDQ